MGDAAFTSFVILADMRTGSNALEEKLNSFERLVSYGEVFNPHFIGGAGKTELLGMTLKAREKDPAAMLSRMRDATVGLAGFRLFSDHDPRAFQMSMDDVSCAKIVLTRNPADSYVSLKIARTTGQWWLGDLKTAKSAKAQFDAAEFEAYVEGLKRWQSAIQRGLQTSGQTGFHIHYDDLSDPQIIEGIARFLGAGSGRGRQPKRGKVQNPKPLSEKVTNFREMERSLAARDPFELDRLPVYEPARGPNVPAYITASTAPLLYMPIKGARDEQLRLWLAALDGTAPDKLETGHSQKTLRRWLRQTRPHTVFSVIAHPLERAHTAFCRHILPGGAEPYPAIRDALVRNYKLELPNSADDAGYDAKEHRAALGGFMAFLQGNLGGQTSIRVDGAWASQTAILQAMAQIAIPERLLRADRLAEELAALAAPHGASAPDLPTVPAFRIGLAEIYDAELEQLAHKAYRRDYMMFGFNPWNASR